MGSTTAGSVVHDQPGLPVAIRHDAWETLVTRHTRYRGRSVTRIFDAINVPAIGQRAESIQPVERNDVPARDDTQVLNDDTIADLGTQTFRDSVVERVRLRWSRNLSQLRHQPGIARRPHGHHQRDPLHLPIGRTDHDHPAMSILRIFRGTHMSQRVVRQVDNKDLPRPPAI